MRVLIDKYGNLSMIYTDSLDVRDLGESEIKRVGHVDPTEESTWEVRVNEEIIGRYSLHEEAVREEIKRVEDVYL